LDRGERFMLEIEPSHSGDLPSPVLIEMPGAARNLDAGTLAACAADGVYEYAVAGVMRQPRTRAAASRWRRSDD
jgi:hypothetical protein